VHDHLAHLGLLPVAWSSDGTGVRATPPRVVGRVKEAPPRPPSFGPAAHSPPHRPSSPPPRSSGTGTARPGPQRSTCVRLTLLRSCSRGHPGPPAAGS